MNIIKQIAIAAVSLLVGIGLAWLVCDIDPAKEYTWYSGLWQGLFFIPNLIRHLLGIGLYKAIHFTTGYTICYWGCAALSCISLITSVFTPRFMKN